MKVSREELVFEGEFEKWVNFRWIKGHVRLREQFEQKIRNDKGKRCLGNGEWSHLLCYKIIYNKKHNKIHTKCLALFYMINVLMYI